MLSKEILFLLGIFCLKKIYVNKARSMYINLTPDSYVNNKRLFERMKKMEFTPSELVNMSTQELFPDIGNN